MIVQCNHFTPAYLGGGGYGVGGYGVGGYDVGGYDVGELVGMVYSSILLQ
jgi:hypothetical protein